MTEALRQHFRPEFLNRIDEVIFFHALGLEHMKAIIDIQMRGLLKRLEDRKIHVELTDAAKGFSCPRATTRCTARGRSSGRFSGGCWTRWRCGCSRASSARATGWSWTWATVV